jgi:hypothetical protein
MNKTAVVVMTETADVLACRLRPGDVIREGRKRIVVTGVDSKKCKHHVHVKYATGAWCFDSLAEVVIERR